MVNFFLGFGACYLATAALMLRTGWADGSMPAGLPGVLYDIGLALIWPCAFISPDVGDDDFTGGFDGDGGQ